jgi:hypothetical protein
MLDHEFLIKPSKIYLGLWGLICSGSIVIALSLPASKWLILCVVIIVLWYSLYLLKRFGLQKHTFSILKLRFQKDGGWLLQTKYETYFAMLSGQSTVTSILCVLCFKEIDSHRLLPCLVFRDSLNGNQYRQLMIILKNQRDHDSF